MAKFILLLHEQPADFSDFSAEDLQAVIAEYSAWRDQLIEHNLLAGGEKLKDEGGKSMTMESGQVKTVDGPYSEAKEVLGGFFMIEANDYAHAVQISSGCPHLKYDGRIELREIDEIH